MSFPLLWELTLGSWLTAALILLVRLLFGRWLNARAKYALWLLLILRLIPLPIRSPTSLLTYAPETLGPEAAETWVAPAADRLAALTAGEAAETAPGGERVRPGEYLRRVWRWGAEAVLALYAVMYAVAALRLRNMIPCEDPATQREYLRLKQQCHFGFSPRLVMGNQGLLGGFFRPVLVIPVDLRGEGAVPILLHELMHYKSLDVWLGLVQRVLCAIHWYNPAVWLCFWLMRRDGELACDRRVLDTGLLEPRAYARALMEEYQRCGETDPMPLTHWGTRGMMKRISDILGYRKSRPRDRVLPIALAAVILVFGVLSPMKARALYGGRSVTSLVGYANGETYVQDLRRTSLGVFGMTWSQLVEAGYLTEDEGTWSPYAPEKQVLTVRRFIAEEELEVRYIFRPTLYTEAQGIQVLTEISVAYPPYEDEDSYTWKVKAEESVLLSGWDTLEWSFFQYNGAYYKPIPAEWVPGWEFLYWELRPEDLEEDVMDSIIQGRKLTYHIRCTPVTLADCLTPEERDALADLAVAKGWAGNRADGLRIMGNWHLAGLVDDFHGRGTEEGPVSRFILNGMGIAIYLTRPGAG